MNKSWVRAVDAVIRGQAEGYRFIRLGPTPSEFRQFGMLAADIAMSAAKIARVRREHPEVSLETLRMLPELVCNPLAIFPSTRRDGSVVVVLVVRDSSNEPVITILMPDVVAGRNVVLSVYGKDDGCAWIHTQMGYAREDGLVVFESEDFAAAVPKPGSAPEDAIPSSPGPIPVDGAAKPTRQILSLRKKSTES